MLICSHCCARDNVSSMKNPCRIHRLCLVSAIHMDVLNAALRNGWVVLQLGRTIVMRAMIRKRVDNPLIFQMM
jgi:hypothetical protein